MKAIIRRWTANLFTEEVKLKLAITERQVFQAATLQELDDVYTRKLAGYETVAGKGRRAVLNIWKLAAREKNNNDIEVTTQRVNSSY